MERSEGAVTMALRPVPSIPSVTCSAVDDDENPEAPFLLNGPSSAHTISLSFSFSHTTQRCTTT